MDYVQLCKNISSDRGIGTETCGIGSGFPPDGLRIGLGTYMSCILI